MTNFGVRLADGLVATVIGTPFAAAAHALLGYVYAKYADLPAGQVAKTWAIWGAAEIAIQMIAGTFSENPRTKLIIEAVALTLTGCIAIPELQKRGVLGNKMAILIIAAKALMILGILSKIALLLSDSSQRLSTDL